MSSREAPPALPKTEVLEKSILEMCSSLSAVGSKTEKAASPASQASSTSQGLSSELREATLRLKSRHPRLGECLETVGEFFGEVASCYEELATSLAVETAAPLRKMAQDCSKVTKRQKKQLDKQQAALESARAKAKGCREKGVTTNMVKLMELEEERDTLKGEFDEMRVSATNEFEARLSQLEVESISSMLACVASHKAFFTAGLASIEKMEAIIGTMQRAVNHQRLRHIPGQSTSGGDGRRNRQALTLPSPLRSLPAPAQTHFERGAEFQVTQLSKKQRRVVVKVMMHLFPPEVHVTDMKTQTTAVRSFEELLQVLRSVKFAKSLELSWKATEKPMILQCSTTGQRERLYECLTFSLASTSALPKKEEVVKLFVGSWNMGDAPPPADVEELGKWIPRTGYDLYAIGVQECEYKPKQAEDADVTVDESSCEADWFGRILLFLGDEFVRVCSLSLMSMRLIIIVRRSKWFSISNVRKSYEACGIANIVGNKGAVAVALQYNETRIAFINSHLAAHLNKFEDRNQDYRYICSNLNIAKESTGSASTSLLNYYHYLFWFGDLNYRLETDQKEVISLVRQARFDDLILHDQLHRERIWGKTFAGFSEGQLSFPPTYRYIRGVRTYNEEKGRVPSWCDRILWKTLPGYSVEQESYGCCDRIMTSDHSPVFGLFTLMTKRPNWPYLPTKTAYIVISGLNASGLSGVSDKAPEASVSFLGPYHVVATTSVAPKSDTPQWSDTIVLEVLTANEEFVASETVFVIVRDNRKKKELADIGQAAISLRDACQAHTSLSEGPPAPPVPGAAGLRTDIVSGAKSVAMYPVDFACKLLSKGVNVGTVKGTIAVVWGAENVPKGENTVMGSQLDQERGMLLVNKPKKKQWTKRWFEIGHGTLNGFQSDTTSKVWKSFPLAGAHVYQLPEAERPGVFRLDYFKAGNQLHLMLCANNIEETEHWLNAIIEASGLVAPLGGPSGLPEDRFALTEMPVKEEETGEPPESWKRPTSPESSPLSFAPSPIALRAAGRGVAAGASAESKLWSNKRASAWASGRGRQTTSPLLGSRRSPLDSPNARSHCDFQSPQQSADSLEDVDDSLLAAPATDEALVRRVDEAPSQSSILESSESSSEDSDAGETVNAAPEDLAACQKLALAQESVVKLNLSLPPDDEEGPIGHLL